ncbi:inactive serine/threonine-protein kinase PLK5 isoform X3 [Alligator mississippiensis]|uniref:inactive serine/threonine-protein kinase PLK5 isoform X3 n=1 Tax=Alligator mississippiensis TaxID=8496 RepID=UPI0028777217|nr:inactive serine/threonine-protein kinase PLK5 isoform X3 [Alligator mississippiensis]
MTLDKPQPPPRARVVSQTRGPPLPQPPGLGSALRAPPVRTPGDRPPGSRQTLRPLSPQGAFGRCYKLTDMATNKVYAVKIVSQACVSRLGSRSKVEREIALHSRLSHPHVVGFHRHFADRDHIYMVLEYCSRRSLAHVLKARKVLTEPEVRYYLRQVIAGLRYLHRQGIIHRDLKLSNFFLTKTMQVKIGDLGLATREDPAGRRRGVVCGTPNYLAPEVIEKRGHSVKSDIWALGCIMYTALTGCSPFEITRKQEMYQCIREGRYPAPSQLSPSARSLITRLLAPDPAARPSLDEVLRHDFFTQGFTPDKLPSRACHSVPLLAGPNPLSKLLQKAAKVLFRAAPCQEPRAGSPGPSEELASPAMPAQPPPSPVAGAWGAAGLGSAPLGPSPGQTEQGNIQAEPLSEEPGRVPIRLLAKGALNFSAHYAGWSLESPVESVTRVLRSCLENTPLAAQRNPPPRQARVLPWVTKWVDYSNKYGFGYLLSNSSTGVLLADGTHLALGPWQQCVHYCPRLGEAVSFARGEVPGSLAVKMGVLHFFSQYMQQKLLEGGDLPAGPGDVVDDLYLLHFAKSDQALLMLFSNQTLQVNFYRDHTKLVLHCAGPEPVLTFVDGERRSAAFPLGALAAAGCTPALRDRMEYALALLQRL